MRPSKEAKLPHVILLHEREHEPDEPNNVHAETEKSMVGDEPSQNLL
jgi:hypothetical protein